MQETFMMIKPDGINHHDEIINMLKEAGLSIQKQNKLHTDMSIMQVLLMHYKDVIDDMGKAFNFPGKLFNSFYFGDFDIVVLHVTYDGEEDIITKTRTLVGATNPQNADEGTIRHRFSKDNYDIAGQENRLLNNVIHASDSKESATRELKIWENYL